MTSVLLPTIRPDYIKRVIENLLMGCLKDMEIIVVSDFNPEFVLSSHVHWIIEKRNGPISAINHAHREAMGDYYFVINDESIVYGEAIGVMEEYYKGRLALGSPRQVSKSLSVTHEVTVGFPFVSRRTLNVLCDNEYLFDPIYRSFYADLDLSARAYARGIPVDICEGALLINNNNNGSDGHKNNSDSYFQGDLDTYTNRWNLSGRGIYYE